MLKIGSLCLTKRNLNLSTFIYFLSFNYVKGITYKVHCERVMIRHFVDLQTLTQKSNLKKYLNIVHLRKKKFTFIRRCARSRGVLMNQSISNKEPNFVINTERRKNVKRRIEAVEKH